MQSDCEMRVQKNREIEQSEWRRNANKNICKSAFARVHQVTMRCDVYQRPLTESASGVSVGRTVGAAIVQCSSVFYCCVCSLLKKCLPLFLLTSFVHSAPLVLYEFSTIHRLYFSRLQLPLMRNKKIERKTYRAAWATQLRSLYGFWRTTRVWRITNEFRFQFSTRPLFVYCFVFFVLLPHRWLCHSSHPFVAVIFKFNSMRCN